MDGEDGLPAALGAGPGEDFIVAVGVKAAFYGDVRGVVAAEEGGVDFDACDGAGGDAEANEHPVEGREIVAAGFPAYVVV